MIKSFLHTVNYLTCLEHCSFNCYIELSSFNTQSLRKGNAKSVCKNKWWKHGRKFPRNFNERKKFSITGTLKVPKVEVTPNAFVMQNKKTTVEPVQYLMFVALHCKRISYSTCCFQYHICTSVCITWWECSMYFIDGSHKLLQVIQWQAEQDTPLKMALIH